MRTILFILISTTFFASITNAQKVKFGILAGPVLTTSNKSNITINTGDTATSYSNTIKSVVSFFGGVQASIPISNSIIFKPQLYYIMKGWKTHRDNLDPTITDFDTKLKSTWIELPLNVVYNVPSRNGRFFVGLGPYVSYAFTGKIHNYLDGSDTNLKWGKPTSAGTKSANRIDVGANVLAGYEFRNGFFVDINYSHGFRDFRNNRTNTQDPTNKNIVVGLGVGYMF